MMKGLLYRNFCLGRKVWIPIWGIAVGMIILNVLVQLSMLYGNLAKADNRSFILIYYIQLYMIPYTAMLTIDSSSIIRSDLTVNWTRNRKIFPVTDFQWICGIYLLKIAFFLIGLILFLLNGIILSGMANHAFSIYEVQNMLILTNLLLLMDTLQMPVLVRARNPKEIEYSMALPCVAGIIIFAFLYPELHAYAEKFERFMNNPPENIPADFSSQLIKTMLQEEFGGIRDAIAPFMPLMTVLLFGTGLYLSWLSMKRREKSA